jgi:hypothetical protein
MIRSAHFDTFASPYGDPHEGARRRFTTAGFYNAASMQSSV